MVLTDAEKKERRKIACKKYRESKKGKETQKKYRESEKGKKTREIYYEANKEDLNEKYRIKYNNNAEDYIEYQRKYRESNEGKETIKTYQESEQGKKTRKKTEWKSMGLNIEKFEDIYERYINTNKCDFCDVELVCGMFGSNKKCMDHCHSTGEFRNILCNTCNIRRK